MEALFFYDNTIIKSNKTPRQEIKQHAPAVYGITYTIFNVTNYSTTNLSCQLWTIVRCINFNSRAHCRCNC